MIDIAAPTCAAGPLRKKIPRERPLTWTASGKTKQKCGGARKLNLKLAARAPGGRGPGDACAF